LIESDNGQCVVKRVIAFAAQIYDGVRKLIISRVGHSTEDADVSIKYHFDKAKILSDFIGMIIRLAYVIGFTAFVYTKSQKDISYIILLLLCMCILFAMFYRIYIIIFQYFARDMTFHSSVLLRLITYIAALYLTYTLMRAILELCIEIAKRTEIAR